MRDVLLLSVFLLSGCSSSFSDAEIVGVYEAEFKGDRATLTLNKDRTCRQAIQQKDSRNLDSDCTWYIYQKESDFRIVFSDFELLPSFGHSRKVRWAPEPTFTWTGRISLCYDFDLGYCYVKLSAS
jgi:hypothetical protein